MWTTQLFPLMRIWLHHLYMDMHKIPATQFNVDPGYWHEIREMDGDENHPEGNDQSSDEQEPEDEAGIDSPEAWEDEKNPYMVSEKREVSDEELWQQLFEANMVDVRGEEHMETPAMK